MGVSLAGARPIPVEPDSISFNLDPQRVAAALTSKTRAIFGTHLYGRAGACAEIDELARQRNLPAFWDAAQAHGAAYGRKPICFYGKATAFSLYPKKNFVCLGDGGAVVTNDASLADQIRCLRNYGSRQRYENAGIGLNSRLDELQAAFLRAKLFGLATGQCEKGRLGPGLCQGFKGNIPGSSFPRG